jgi:hypothetical protein
MQEKLQLKIFSRRKNRSDYEREKIVVIDIETRGLRATPDNFLFGVVLEYNAGWEYRKFISLDAMRAYLTSYRMSGKYIFAHNGGNFDYLILFGNMFKFFGSENVIYNGSRFIYAKYKIRERKTEDGKSKNEYCYFYDSLNIANCSLREIGEIMGTTKGILSAKLFSSNQQRWNNNLIWGKERITKDEWEYCKMDCYILFNFLHHFYTLIEKIMPTIASSSMRFFRTNYLQKDIHVREELDFYFHEAYYGGRVEAYYIGKIPDYAVVYDINSLYPFSMIYKPYEFNNTIPDKYEIASFPDPSKLNIIKNPSLELFYQIINNTEYEGMANITAITNKKFEFGYLPVRDGKLYFPNLDIDNESYCFPELRLAIKRGYIDIKKVNYVVFASKIETPFKQFVLDLYEKKKNSPEPFRSIYKRILNSLYGKFAEHRKEEKYYLEYYDREKIGEYQFEYCPKGKSDKSFCENRCLDCPINYQPFSVEREDGYLTVKKDEFDGLLNHTIFCFSAYITSYSRVQNILFQEYIRKHGKIYYTDTDSFFCNPELELITDKDLIGCLKKEKKIISAIYGCKNYIVRTEEGRDEKIIKGIPKYAKEKDNNTYEFAHIYKLKEALRRNKPIGEVDRVLKELKEKYDKGIIINGGDVKPIGYTSE